MAYEKRFVFASADSAQKLSDTTRINKLKTTGFIGQNTLTLSDLIKAEEFNYVFNNISQEFTSVKLGQDEIIAKIAENLVKHNALQTQVAGIELKVNANKTEIENLKNVELTKYVLLDKYEDEQGDVETKFDEYRDEALDHYAQSETKINANSTKITSLEEKIRQLESRISSSSSSSSVSSLQSRVSSLESRVSSLSSSVSGYSSRISTAESRVNSATSTANSTLSSLNTEKSKITSLTTRMSAVESRGRSSLKVRLRTSTNVRMNVGGKLEGFSSGANYFYTLYIFSNYSNNEVGRLQFFQTQQGDHEYRVNFSGYINENGYNSTSGDDYLLNFYIQDGDIIFNNCIKIYDTSKQHSKFHVKGVYQYILEVD